MDGQSLRYPEFVQQMQADNVIEVEVAAKEMNRLS